MLPLIAFMQVESQPPPPVSAPYPYWQQPSVPGPPTGAAPDAERRGRASLPKPEPTPGFIGRLSLGFGPVIPSAQERLLGKEGYSGGRWLGVLDGVGRMEGRFLLGGFIAGATRSVKPDVYGPPVTDDVVFVGVEGMLLAGDGSCRFPLVARLGYARGGESFHGNASSENAPAFGADVGMLCLHVPVGVSGGFLFAPAAAPGDLGGSWNMGSFHISVVFDAHS